MNSTAVKNALLSTVALVVGAVAADASPIDPSWSRTAPYSTYQAWDVFSDPAVGGTNAPNSPNNPFGSVVDAAPHNTNGVANVRDTSGQSFITGGGNIYSFSAPTNIVLTNPEFALGSNYVTTVLFQTRTQGSEAIYTGANGIRLTYTDGTGAHTVTPVSAAELNRQALGGFGGSLVDYATLFQVPGSPTSLTINVDAAESSMSFDRASIDTITTRATAGATLLPDMNTTVGFVSQAVPEPASLGAIAVVGSAMLARRRRRNPVSL